MGYDATSFHTSSRTPSSDAPLIRAICDPIFKGRVALPVVPEFEQVEAATRVLPSEKLLLDQSFQL